MFPARPYREAQWALVLPGWCSRLPVTRTSLLGACSAHHSVPSLLPHLEFLPTYSTLQSNALPTELFRRLLLHSFLSLCSCSFHVRCVCFDSSVAGARRYWANGRQCPRGKQAGTCTSAQGREPGNEHPSQKIQERRVSPRACKLVLPGAWLG